MRPGRVIFALSVLLAAVGCAKPGGVLFPPPAKPLAWPAPPEDARIVYVGQLATSADLKPPRKFLEGLGQAVFGKKEVATVLSPYAVCTDGGDRLFIADTAGQVVHVMNLKTRKYERWEAKERHRLTQPVGVAFDSDNARLLVADSVGQAIFAFDGATGQLRAALAQNVVQRPGGIAVERGTGRIMVADIHAHSVMVLSSDGQVIQRLGQRGAADGEFNYPTNVTIDSKGRLYVADSLNFRVQQFSQAAGGQFVFTRQIGYHGDVPGSFSQPKGLAVDGDDHLYVVDSRFENVQIFDHEGRLLLYFGEEGQGPGQFWLPAGICIDGRNRVWVADTYNKRVQVFDYVPRAEVETPGPATVPVIPAPFDLGARQSAIPDVPERAPATRPENRP